LFTASGTGLRGAESARRSNWRHRKTWFGDYTHRLLGKRQDTLINRVLKEQHGHRIAVIENEFGEAGVDNEILRAKAR